MLVQSPKSKVQSPRIERASKRWTLDFGHWTLDSVVLALNYFNYFTEIEDAFIRRRGKHLLVSSIDWALIETWKAQGVPLHIALRGIEKAFDSWESKPRKRSIKSLLYCQEEVEAQYAEWIESRVGAGTDQSGESSEGEFGDGQDDGLPFPRQAILEHLRRGRSALLETLQQRQRVSADDLVEALSRAANLLEELERDFFHSSRADAQKLEVSLTGLERMLSESIQAVIPTEDLNEITSEIKEQLRPYRGHMDKAAYKQTMDNLLQKRLREKFAVPRLSLFYL